MPIYEFKCNECGNKFEMLRSVGDHRKDLQCPKCESKKVQKIFSVVSSIVTQARASCKTSTTGFS